jgi:hypothetical protein
VRRLVKRGARLALGRLGYRLAPASPLLPPDFTREQAALWELVAPYTMTTTACVAVLADAVRHVIREDIGGAIVECGVWRGGSMMAVAKTLVEAGRDDVDLYLYDTFEGMSAPTERDVHSSGRRADELLAADRDPETSVLWARAQLEDVRRAMALVPYPASRLHFVQGPIEETISDRAPSRIALLRLDTDWYASTKHELIHLYPRLAQGGVLIIDDYGSWRGAQEATDEYFDAHPPRPLLVRIDDGGARLAVKPSDR